MHRREPAFARPARWAVVGLLASLLLAGCSDADDDGGLAEAGPTVTASASPSPTPTAEPTASASPAAANPIEWRAPTQDDRPDEEGSDLYLGRYPDGLTQPDRLAALTAFMEFWQVRLELGARAEVDPGAIGAVATGNAAQNTVSLLEGAKRRGGTIQGDAVMHIEGVKLSGRRATVRACMENLTTDRDANGEPTETLTPFYTVGADLVREGDDWRMTDFRASTGVC